VVRALRPLHAVAVENRVGPGTPDVNHSLGWMELKWRKTWPKIKPHEPVLFEHFTPQQRIWLRSRAERGGMVHLMAKIGQDWIVLDGAWAAEHFGRVGSEVLLQLNSAWRCHGKLDGKGLVSWLRAS